MTITTERDSIGRHLKASRALAGMDQKTIADALGVSRTTVSGWELGQFEPTFSLMVRWSQITGHPLEWFAEDLVRPERLELPTFCSGAWSVADDAAVWLYSNSRMDA